MILILSNKWDVTVDFVVKELRQRNHPFLRLNTEELAVEQATVSLPDFHIWVSKRSEVYDLTRDIRVIWNRRPGKPFDDVPRIERPSLATQHFVNDQWYSWLESLQLIPGVTWINHPQADSAMESKIRQLQLASRIGFPIPRTLISNDPNNVRVHLQKSGGKLVTKALYSPLIEEPEQDYFIFSTEISEISADSDTQIRLCPSIFQESLSPKTDYRVTVVGDRVLPARVESSSGSPVALDWRTQKDGLTFRRCNLPAEIEELCRNFVLESGLVFGAIDLVERDGRFVFLEINPNGEWGWLQKPYGIPIADTLCDLMVRQDSSEATSNAITR